MKFSLTNISGYQFRLLLISPNWDRVGTEISHTIDTEIGVGRTDIEERRPGRSAMILTQKCTLQLLGNDADDFQKGLAALGALPIGMPLWIDALPVSRWSERIYDPQQIVNFDPVSGAFAFYTPGTLPGTPPYPMLAPLLVGRFKGAKRPDFSATSKGMATVDFTLQEASPITYRIGVNSYGSGWTALPDRTISPVKVTSDYLLEEFRLSAAREPGLDRTNSAARWKQEGSFRFMDRLEIRRALTHFVDRKGALKSWFPAPAWFQPGAGTSATPDNLTARFASDSFTLHFVNGNIAESRVAFFQEIYTPTVAQEQPGEVFLYKLAYDFDTANPELTTNWDAPITISSEVFQPSQTAHQDIRKSLRPQDEKADVNQAYAAGSLIADWIKARLYARVRLTIWKCDPANAAATRVQIFGGYIDEILPDGNNAKITATLLKKALKDKSPSRVFGPPCGTYVFSDLCGLDEATHSSAGTSVPPDLSSDGRTLTLHGVTGWSGPTYADNFFANGILRTGTGRSKMVATILSSSTSGGNIVVKVRRPLWADLIAGAGQSVQLVPGCGLQYEGDCGTKFSNQVNFRGFPFIPDYIETHAAGAPTGMKK